MGDSGRWRELSNIIKTQFPEAQITSTYRPGSVAAGSNRGDYHSTGDAVDIAGGNMMKYFDWLVSTYPGSAEIIHTPGGDRQIKDGKPHRYSGVTAAGHFDHVHWAAPDLGAARQGGTSQGGAPSPLDGLIPGIEAVSKFLAFFSDPGMWFRVAAAIGGALLLLIGIAGLVGRQAFNFLPTGRAAKLIKGVTRNVR